jgi:hypothetical protein
LIINIPKILENRKLRAVPHLSYEYIVDADSRVNVKTASTRNTDERFVHNWQSESGCQHEAWEKEFQAWAATNLRFDERQWLSIGYLHSQFCEWCSANESVPCTRQVFDALLSLEGFACDRGLVHGLVPSKA